MKENTKMATNPTDPLQEALDSLVAKGLSEIISGFERASLSIRPQARQW